MYKIINQHEIYNLHDNRINSLKLIVMVHFTLVLDKTIFYFFQHNGISSAMKE